MTSNQPTMRKLIANCLNALGLLGSRAYSGKMKFGPIPADVSEDMERQRAFVAKLLSQHFPGKHLAGSTEDFAILQGIVDKQLLTERQAWELQALGI